MAEKGIKRSDILDMKAYEQIRRKKRTEVVKMKRFRRVPVGPDATFFFENYDTMWWQIHEMLFIEKGGESQIEDELTAYNPLIPKGRELVATLMFEIDDPSRRKNILSCLGGVEETCVLVIDGEEVIATPEADTDRTTTDGKASSVQFLHFPLNEKHILSLKKPGTYISVGITHPNYGHIAVISEHTRAALAGDLD